MSSECGYCLDGQHERCVGGGTRWTCECTVTRVLGIHEREVGKFVSEAEVAAHPWVFVCPVDGCWYGVCVDTQAEAEMQQATHGCPRTGAGVTGSSILHRAWAQLDEQVDEIMALLNLPPDAAREEHLAVAKARARGKAEILALFMVPHFRTADEIAAEAGVRYAARQRGDVAYETIGLGSRRAEFQR